MNDFVSHFGCFRVSRLQRNHVANRGEERNNLTMPADFLVVDSKKIVKQLCWLRVLHSGSGALAVGLPVVEAQVVLCHVSCGCCARSRGHQK